MITHETRRESYKNTLKTLSNRQSQVFSALLPIQTGITASELALSMHEMGYFRSAERNNVHPRLNEMTELGIVEVIGKRQCRVTNKTVAVYNVKNDVSRYVKESVL